MANPPENCLLINPEASAGDLYEAICDRLDGISGVLGLIEDHEVITGARLHIMEARMLLEELRERVPELTNEEITNE